MTAIINGYDKCFREEKKQKIVFLLETVRNVFETISEYIILKVSFQYQISILRKSLFKHMVVFKTSDLIFTKKIISYIRNKFILCQI